jgi:protein tyrosine phosphatase (PTP) superfamily phosphohydrolase (DUF442 family)
MPRLLPLVALLLAACAGFHQVSADVYRSQQVNEGIMASRMIRHGVRSVVCLRGGPGAAATRRAALAAGARFHHVPLSAIRLPTPATLLALWQVVATAERPLLIHCLAGVDRTGLASALAVLHDTGDLARARAQLGLIPFGHVAWSPTGAMDEVLDRYAPYAAALAFPDWVRQIYAAEWALCR